jgi:hypothetical protein
VVVDNGTDIKTDKDSRFTRVGSEATVNGPVLVNARVGSPVSTESVWILAQHGVRADSNTAGQIDGWTSIKPTAPRVLGTFEDNFELITDGWVAAGAVSRLEKRDKDLQATLSKGQGQIARNVDWDLTNPGYTYVAVFELAGRNIRSAGISVTGDDGAAKRSFAVTGDLASYGFMSVELKPAHYTTIKIAADPGTNTGRIHLHTYRLYAIPKGDSAS